MAKEKPKGEEAGDEKKLPPIRIRGELHEAVHRASARLVTTPTEVVNRAVREFLEREGYWLPPGQTSGQDS